MTEYLPYVKDFILVVCIPAFYFTFKLHERVVRQEERHNALVEKVNHNWNNVRQALDHVSKELEDLTTDVKELLKLYSKG